MKVFVKARQTEQDTQPVTATEEGIEVFEVPENPSPRRKRKKTVKVLRTAVIVNGSEEGVERRVPVDVPHYRLASKDDFDRPWHVALWAPNDPEGPTVL